MTFTEPVPGHWSTEEGTAMANAYATKTREELAFGQRTDLELANAIFMADRNDLSLIGLQTAAKERIRWLSVQLALAGASTPSPSRDDLLEKVAQAYQIIGRLLQEPPPHSSELTRALDYFADETAFAEDFLPWPAAHAGAPA